MNDLEITTPGAAPAASSPAQVAPAAVAAAVAPAQFSDLPPSSAPGQPAPLRMLGEIPLDVTVELGRTAMKVRDVLGLREGSVVELDRAPGAPVDVLVNGRLVARGDVVVVDDEFGVRIIEVMDSSRDAERA